MRTKYIDLNFIIPTINALRNDVISGKIDFHDIQKREKELKFLETELQNED